jgi:uncharacterized DUF497 family protein
MDIEFDPEKRNLTLRERGLDFADAGRIFDGPKFTLEDRFDYPEPRSLTFGLLDERMVMIAWTPTETGIRVISMRKCNDRERKKFAARMG